MHLVLLCPALLLALAARVAKSDLLSCGKPPEIKHAYRADEADAADQLEDKYKVGTEVAYTCQFGYVATGRSRIIRCDQIIGRAQWREPEFSCTPQSCGDPGHIPNGFRVGSLFTFPNNVTYHCDVGYILRGIEGKTRYCQTSGQWSGRLPVCEVVTCDYPKDIPNGHATASSYEYGATLRYRCDNGYRLSSDEDIYCTENGTWSNTDVTCEEILCEMPEKPEFGYVSFRGSEKSPRAGNIAIFSCEEGRIPSGPTTSKCLDIGEWTFPAPKCLEPCKIQSIFNGVIGKYVRKSKWSSLTVYKEIEVGTRVEENEDLHIRCYEGFEVPGSERRETRITCSKGRWSSDLECKPASCLSSPPYSQNANIVQIDRKHEGTVSYECFRDYKKTIEETVVCAYGKWNGKPPQCNPTKCSRDSLTYPGIVKGLKPFYIDGEVFSYTCEYPRYEKPAGHNGQIRCIDGTWTGDSPFCQPAKCTNPPPSIDHGKVKYSTMLHGTIAKYDCEDPYFLVSNPLVQCSFGAWIWTGQLPKCQDSRCYLRNLAFKSNISPLTQTFTPSGDKLNVICEEGYSANTKLPVCEKGVWKGNTYESICKESGCQVPRILYGSLTEKLLGRESFNIWTFRYERKVEYKKVSVGNTVPSAKVLHLFCEDGRTYQGTGHQIVAVQCIRGRWNTDPVCLRRGDTYIPTTTVKPRLSSPRTIISPHSVTSSYGLHGPSEAASSKEFPLPTSPSRVLTSLATEEVTTTSVVTDPKTENVEDQCSCYYPVGDRSVVAHVNGKRLSLGDNVKNGETIIFRCLHVGYHHLMGRTEITCADCQPWHSSDFPTCTEPQKGNVVVIFDDNVRVLEDGTLEINKGQNVNFSCIAMETAEYPEWNVPDSERISFKTETKDRKQFNDILYQTHFYIQGVDYSHVGTYYCFLKNHRNTSFNITVIDPDIHCPVFPDDDDLIITYEKDIRENSKAFFSCRNKNLELVGEPVSTCLRTQEWSAPLPFCAARCKKLKDSDHLTVQYTNNREVGSLALFHCFAPGIRIGASSAECLKNGSWSQPTPSCRDVRCKILNGTDSLAIDYLPADRKVNSTATFHCFSPAKRTGVSSTKCLQNGSWADPIPTCKIPSCTAENLLSLLPHNAQPAIEIGKDDSFTVNSTVRLTCKNHMVVRGNPLATCGNGSKWIFDKIECDSACQPPTRRPDSKVKLNPEKNVYKFGEQVTLLCPPGMKLDSEPQVIMCFVNGWSEKTLPDCVLDDKTKNYQTTKQDVPQTSAP